MINFIINILIVEGCSLIMCEETKWYKTLISAFVGAVYAVAVFFPSLEFFQSFAMKLIISGIMVGLGFKITNKIRFLKIWCSFYLVSFIFGGAIMAIMSITSLGAKSGAIISNGSIYFSLPWQFVILTSAAVYFMIIVFSRVRKKRIAKEAIGRLVKIYINGKTVEMKAIIDTGNTLSDPITGDPVIVCEYDELKCLFTDTEGVSTIMEKMALTGMRIRLIPFSSIGEEKGVMPGFMPDRVEIDQYQAKRCVICISENKLSKEEEYHALLNPMLIVN
ncbi:MAG: sigma-E processing peptidase SpoIIGA [Clostridia bacterium]